MELGLSDHEAVTEDLTFCPAQQHLHYLSISVLVFTI